MSELIGVFPVYLTHAPLCRIAPNSIAMLFPCYKCNTTARVVFIRNAIRVGRSLFNYESDVPVREPLSLREKPGYLGIRLYSRKSHRL